MTSPWWIFGVVVLYIGMLLIGGLMELNYLAPGDTGVIYDLTHPSLSLDAIGGYVSSLWTLITFDYPFLEGTWVIIRLLFMGMSAGIVFTTLLNVIRGVG